MDWSGPRVGQNVATQKFCLGRSLSPEEERKEKLRGYSLDVEQIRRASLENPPHWLGEELRSRAEKVGERRFLLFLRWKMEGL